jgi:superfamily II DNA or RNA helicase
MATLSQLLDCLSSDPNTRGAQFERICKWFLLNDPGYNSDITRVWLWDEWPRRWAADEGIDLVAEAHDKSLWAIQAKAYDPRYSIKKSDVDSFLSASARPEFSYRLLIATTNQIGKKAERTLQQQEKPAGRLLRADLERASVEWPASPDRLRAPKPKPKKPRPHQREALNAVVKCFKATDRGQLIMACGTGKTLVGLWALARLQSTRTLILLPSLSLLAQTLREWTANAKEPFSVLAVCSDETVRGDSWTSHTSDLGRPVTTDPEDIAAFLRKRGRRVVFATYQSSPRVKEAFTLGRVPAFDLAIADEAHRVAGALDTDFATILDADAIKARNRLFMTATPRFFTGRVKKKAKEAEHEIVGMRDIPHFGPEFHRLTFGEAIERDLLSDYQVVIVGVDNPTYREYAERGTFVFREGKKTDARTLAAHIALAKATKKYDLRRTISFHSRISRARQFSADFPEVVTWMPEDERPDGELVSDFVSGEMPSGQRDARLDQLRYLDDDQRGLLSNARCLSEGVDVPTLDGVAFIDPRRSQVDIVQSVGRAIRKAEDKTAGTIVLPVFIAEHEDPDGALDDSAFNHIWQVLRALRDHDDVLAEWLDRMRREIGRRGSISGDEGLPDPIIFEGVGPEFARAFRTRLVEQTTASWEFWYGLLERFVHREGHTRVPLDHIEHDFRLGSWVSNQRTEWKKGQLQPDRARRLKELPGWVWDVIEAQWEEAFEHLRAFVKRVGHADVPQGQVESGFRLGQWVSVQRRSMKLGRLSHDRFQRLESFEGWVWDVLSARWEDCYEHLVTFVEREGHANVPSDHTEAGLELGRWVGKQRAVYKTRGLSAGRVRSLQALPGWAWDANAAAWEEGFARLSDFVQREGHAGVPSDHAEGGFGLGRWVVKQRSAFRAGRLPKGRCMRLDALSGWVWDARAARWEEGFEHLMQFRRREGHARVLDEHIEGDYRLGQWVGVQRGLYRSDRLQEERVSRLEAVPGWAWDIRDAAWEEGFEALRSFADREGHPRAAFGHIEDQYGLGNWVAKQRRDYKLNRLDTDRIARLESLQGWAWDARSARWEAGYDHLLRYMEREGHARVPAKLMQDGFRLGQWVGVQRTSFRDGTMSAERVARLEALPGWVWDAREG